MTSSSKIAVRELPLFPLPEVVLFPTRPLPLHIFEFRYRIMMNTILESDRRFGVLMIDPTKGTIANVGCCAEILHYQRLPDDRIKLLALGQQRFRVLEYVREKPYRVGLVEWIEDQPPAKDLRPLASEVEQLLRDVVRLSAKLTEQEIELPNDLPDLPTELSYWIASNLYGVAPEQQALLEIQDTVARLEREAEILTSTRNHLAARSVLKDTFNEIE
ncbi:MAG: LON peptidase substrate-binding domain-containing protein [Dolichospermum sp. JUN01]|jgi:ATP-dependent Lon protease|uniref:LON peptidase substrate-binding domain-containing protein n=1 Tax=Dolichospermum flos-aquae CCAP 1403/13F TaxID=315271 RepID=A0A6H2BWQ8_DOLFA|nr:LON peptidase substrate-binding domain-containing protein [Dolichospermum flos-aquae]MBO1049912.1 LON peptidase substrate-binding domain-containing protein [Dolichospermum sp. DEX182a]MBO1057878.1 LON peptidase substrate-binding domain-containing protein [Dolichospermum sp. JUN01]MBS9385587.1 LON peptidase substrate-binding domain-containing protein [Dolichospermum sp. BR01]MBS9391793.1 LON peptidase substrate-binding domain-containing protein [Dolichospermum sp. OL01]MCO5795441.1 LON pepti